MRLEVIFCASVIIKYPQHHITMVCTQVSQMLVLFATMGRHTSTLHHSFLLQNVFFWGRKWWGWTRNTSLIPIPCFVTLIDELTLNVYWCWHNLQPNALVILDKTATKVIIFSPKYELAWCPSGSEKWAQTPWLNIPHTCKIPIHAPLEILGRASDPRMGLLAPASGRGGHIRRPQHGQNGPGNLMWPGHSIWKCLYGGNTWPQMGQMRSFLTVTDVLDAL